MTWKIYIHGHTWSSEHSPLEKQNDQNMLKNWIELWLIAWSVSRSIIVFFFYVSPLPFVLVLFLGSKAVSANIYAELQRMDSCPCFHSFLSNCFLLQPVFLNYNCYIELCSPAQVGSPSSARSGFWSWPTFRTLRWSYTGWSGPRCFSLLPSSSWWRCFIWTIKKNAEWQHTRNIHNLWKMAFSTRLFPKIIIFSLLLMF